MICANQGRPSSSFLLFLHLFHTVLPLLKHLALQLYGSASWLPLPGACADTRKTFSRLAGTDVYASSSVNWILSAFLPCNKNQACRCALSYGVGALHSQLHGNGVDGKTKETEEWTCDGQHDGLMSEPRDLQGKKTNIKVSMSALLSLNL